MYFYLYSSELWVLSCLQTILVLLWQLQHPPKFWPNFGASLEFLLDVCKHLSSLCGLVWVFAPSLLDHSMKKFCMLVTMSCLQPCFGRAKSFHFVCTFCVHYVDICRTHTQSCIHCCATVVMVVQRSITSITLFTRTVCQSCRAYVVLMVWGISSSSYDECVFTKFTYAQIHSLTRLVILPMFRRLDHPLTVGPSPCNRLDQLLPRPTQKCATIHFNLHWLQADHPTLPLVSRIVWPGSHPGTHSPQKLHRSCRPFLLH